MNDSELRRKQIRNFVLISAVGFIADQVTKWWAVAKLTDAFSRMGAKEAASGFWEKLDRFLWVEHPRRANIIEVIPDYWHFRYVENPGAAWGFLADAPDYFRTPFFIVVSIVAMGAMIYFFKNAPREAKLFRVALAMVMSGAIGNFVDRIRLGYVIDFIDWHWYDYHWPTFNIADSFISVGVALLMLDVIINGSLYEEAKQ